jgi:hypothetical protein
VLGDYWSPIIERVREVEAHHNSRWGEAVERLVHVAHTPAEAAEHLEQRLWPNGRTSNRTRQP